MTALRPVLYVKPGCSWCYEAEDYLKAHGISYDRANVSADPKAFAAMVELSGQSKAPTMDWDGEVLADFGVDELEAFLRQRGVVK